MAARKPQKKSRRSPSKSEDPKLALNPRRTGMPALDSITGVDEYGTGKQRYRIIHTNEVDEYEVAPKKRKRSSSKR